VQLNSEHPLRCQRVSHPHHHRCRPSHHHHHGCVLRLGSFEPASPETTPATITTTTVNRRRRRNADLSLLRQAMSACMQCKACSGRRIGNFRLGLLHATRRFVSTPLSSVWPVFHARLPITQARPSPTCALVKTLSSLLQTRLFATAAKTRVMMSNLSCHHHARIAATIHFLAARTVQTTRNPFPRLRRAIHHVRRASRRGPRPSHTPDLDSKSE
jgi:hypothetical protein